MRCWHKWTNWRAPEKGIDRYFMEYSGRWVQSIIMYQSRLCIKCDKVDITKLDLYIDEKIDEKS